MSKEYIERESLLEEEQEICYWDGLHDVYGDFIRSEIIKKFPAADVMPVVHAHWVPAKYGPSISCSNCGNEAGERQIGPEDTEYIRSPFCPECGARMDGGK